MYNFNFVLFYKYTILSNRYLLLFYQYILILHNSIIYYFILTSRALSFYYLYLFTLKNPLNISPPIIKIKIKILKYIF